VHIDRPMSSRDEWQRGAERVSALIAQVSENAVSRGLVAVRWRNGPFFQRSPESRKRSPLVSHCVQWNRHN
jgi:hypothetical protein